MDNLKLYTIDNDYMKYLFNFDNHVMYWDKDNYKSERKYLGVILKINEFKYFAPLSSPKESDYYYKKRVKLIRKSNISIIRLVTDKHVLLGKIKLSSMIPAKDEYITFYDVEAEPDLKYKDLVLDEIICIRKCKEIILKNARILYSQKSKGYENIDYLKSTIDFKKLEKACLRYNPQN